MNARMNARLTCRAAVALCTQPTVTEAGNAEYDYVSLALSNKTSLSCRGVIRYVNVCRGEEKTKGFFFCLCKLMDFFQQRQEGSIQAAQSSTVLFLFKG